MIFNFDIIFLQSHLLEGPDYGHYAIFMKGSELWKERGRKSPVPGGVQVQTLGLMMTRSVLYRRGHGLLSWDFLKLDFELGSLKQG